MKKSKLIQHLIQLICGQDLNQVRSCDERQCPMHTDGRCEDCGSFMCDYPDCEKLEKYMRNGRRS